MKLFLVFGLKILFDFLEKYTHFLPSFGTYYEEGMRDHDLTSS